MSVTLPNVKKTLFPAEATIASTLPKNSPVRSVNHNTTDRSSDSNRDTPAHRTHLESHTPNFPPPNAQNPHHHDPTRTTRRKTTKPEDSGYLSTDSNESLKRRVRAPETLESDTDESLGDGHSESGAESVETHSVFFGKYRRQPTGRGGYGSVDSGVMGGEADSSDSETVSYTTVVPVVVGKEVG